MINFIRILILMIWSIIKTSFTLPGIIPLELIRPEILDNELYLIKKNNFL